MSLAWRCWQKVMLMSKQVPNPTALIIGRGPASARAALELAQAGAGVTLLTGDDGLSPGADGPAGVPSLLQAARHQRINLLTGATIQAIQPGLRGDPGGCKHDDSCCCFSNHWKLLSWF